MSKKKKVMEYEDFLGILMPYKKILEDFRELYSTGFDFLEGKYQLENEVSKILDSALNSHFDEQGVEWIYWFIYENDWGEKDWSIYKVFNSQGEITDRDPMEAYGAKDRDGNPICYSFESTWDLVKNHLKTTTK